jgi:hypothetical protein
MLAMRQAAASSPSIYTIDTTSGAATFLAAQSSAIGLVYGLAPIVPEPSTWTMFGLAC